ncbi:putative permease [Escherichia coli]|uniref:Putative permease n=1 Tax=Escherichia coli TaxID=562 RepID=A0A377E3X6_ECOLX|nr:putative permease [Escherichia coli]
MGGPWSSRHQDEVLAEAKANLAWRRWRKGNSSKRLMAARCCSSKALTAAISKDVFLAQIRPKGNARPSVVVADSGHLTQLRDGSQVVTLTRERASKALHCYVISALRISRIIRRSLVTRRWCSTRTIPTRWTCAHCGTLTPIVLAQN